MMIIIRASRIHPVGPVPGNDRQRRQPSHWSMSSYPPNPNGPPPPPPSSASGSGSSQTAADAEPRKIEGIKQYYQQLCTTYRQVSQELQQPDLAPDRRATLTAQLEKLQAAIQDFTERFIKPIINAGARVSPRPSGTATPVGVGPGRPTRPGAASGPPSTQQPPPSAAQLTPQPPVGIPGPVMMAAGARAKPELGIVLPPSTVPVAKGAIEMRTAAMSEATARLLRETYPQDGVLLESTAAVRSRQAANEGASGKALLPSLLRSLVPPAQLTREAEEIVLVLADHYLRDVCEAICESARHRGRPGISTKDVELAMAREMGMASSAAGLPFSVPVAPMALKVPAGRKASTSNPHTTRIQQLRRHLAANPA